jgi:hypothetical protein
MITKRFLPSRFLGDSVRQNWWICSPQDIAWLLVLLYHSVAFGSPNEFRFVSIQDAFRMDWVVIFNSYSNLICLSRRKKDISTLWWNKKSSGSIIPRKKSAKPRLSILSFAVRRNQLEKFSADEPRRLQISDQWGFGSIEMSFWQINLTLPFSFQTSSIDRIREGNDPLRNLRSA